MENVPTIKFAAGEIVFKEGDPSNSVYLIISGKVEVSLQRGNDKVILTVQGENTLFGEMALIDGKPRSATVKAIETSFCYKCSANNILKELQKIDKEIYITMQHLAAIIRQNNDCIVNNNKEVIFDKNIKKPFITKEEIMNNVALNQKIEALNPLIKSMYRLLLKIAYN